MEKALRAKYFLLGQAKFYMKNYPFPIIDPKVDKFEIIH